MLAERNINSDQTWEFAEFQEGSRELEAELEAQLEQSEVRIKEYRSLANRFQMDNDQLKSKLEQCHREYHFQVGLSQKYSTFYWKALFQSKQRSKRGWGRWIGATDNTCGR